MESRSPSKNEEWSYENEERQIFKLDQLKCQLLSNGTPGYFLPFPPTALVSVSLGTRSPPALAHMVRSLLSDSRFSHVKLDRAGLHESKFALEFA
jgi:hypothetical protein